MAMLDYGAVVKKNGKILPYAKDSYGFNNYSTLNGGTLHEEYEDMIWPGDNKMHKTLVKSEYIGDESVREFGDDERSVIHNYMSVVGDKDYLVATYKHILSVFDAERCILEYSIGEDEEYSTERYKKITYLDATFCDIKIKRVGKCLTAIASFEYKDDNYEILFGYGVDEKDFIMSKYAERWFNYDDLKEIRKWYLK